MVIPRAHGSSVRMWKPRNEASNVNIQSCGKKVKGKWKKMAFCCMAGKSIEAVYLAELFCFLRLNVQTFSRNLDRFNLRAF